MSTTPRSGRHRGLLAIALFSIGLAIASYTGAMQSALRHFPDADLMVGIVLVHFANAIHGPVDLMVGDSRVEQWGRGCIEGKGSREDRVRNLGRAGSSARHWNTLAHRYSAILPEVDRLVIWLGYNDLFDAAMPPPDVANQVWLLADKLAPRARRVVVIGQIPVRLADSGQDKFLNDRIQALEAALERTQSRLARGRFVALYPTFLADLQREGRLYRDGIHLSQGGDDLVCREVRAALGSGA